MLKYIIIFIAMLVPMIALGDTKGQKPRSDCRPSPNRDCRPAPRPHSHIYIGPLYRPYPYIYDPYVYPYPVYPYRPRGIFLDLPNVHLDIQR